VDAQAEQFNEALTPILATAAKSTVRVWAGKQRLAYGTVVGDGRTILTKFSEIARAAGKLVGETGAGPARPARPSGPQPTEERGGLTLGRGDRPRRGIVALDLGDPALGLRLLFGIRVWAGFLLDRGA